MALSENFKKEVVSKTKPPLPVPDQKRIIILEKKVKDLEKEKSKLVYEIKKINQKLDVTNNRLAASISNYNSLREYLKK